MLGYPRQRRHRIEVARPVEAPAADEQARARAHRLFDLALDGFEDLLRRERADVDILAHGIADLEPGETFHHAPLEVVVHPLMHDEALGRTMKGSEPPSSMTAFLRCLPASSATFEPAASEPVSVTALTRSSAITRATRAEPRSRV